MIHLKLTEEQAQIVSKACEFFARIRMGQYMEIVHNCLDVKQEHYSEKREALSRVLLHAREFTHPDLERTFGHSYGMGKYEDADRAFDVHQVIRHALGDDREPFSHYDLPKCELELQHTEDVVVLPCKMGDIVWGLKQYNHKLIVKQGTVHQMFFGEDMRLCVCVKNVCRGEWGQNVFATKEEAEAAIAKMEE